MKHRNLKKKIIKPTNSNNIIIFKVENEFDNYLNKDFGNWPWEGNTTLKQWKSAVCDNKDSLLTWAKARTGFDGEFMKQVTELRDVINR